MVSNFYISSSLPSEKASSPRYVYIMVYTYSFFVGFIHSPIFGFILEIYHRHKILFGQVNFIVWIFVIFFLVITKFLDIFLPFITLFLFITLILCERSFLLFLFIRRVILSSLGGKDYCQIDKFISVWAINIIPVSNNKRCEIAIMILFQFFCYLPHCICVSFWTPSYFLLFSALPWIYSSMTIDIKSWARRILAPCSPQKKVGSLYLKKWVRTQCTM